MCHLGEGRSREPFAYAQREVRKLGPDIGRQCILYFTTIPGAYAAAEAVATLRRGPLSVRALQDDTGGPPPWAASLMP